MVRLTDEQFAHIDAAEDNDRILCAGGAGTGKTFLAAELARRQAALGRLVTLCCSSPTLAAFLSARVGNDASIEVIRETTPSQVAPSDYLVVDEGQDLLNFTALNALDARVKGGLKDGKWCVFYDGNAQSGLIGSYDPEALALLQSYGATTIRLKRNCRNTIPIVTQTRLMTGADLGTPMAGEGPSMRTVYYKDAEDQAKALDTEIRRLREEGVEDGEITILTTCSPAQSTAVRSGLAERYGMRLLTSAVTGAWPCAAITVSSVADFKGLENTFVLVTDIDDFAQSGRSRNLVYVAMSRARVGLWLGIHESLKNPVKAIMAGNLSAVIAR